MNLSRALSALVFATGCAAQTQDLGDADGSKGDNNKDPAEERKATEVDLSTLGSIPLLRLRAAAADDRIGLAITYEASAGVSVAFLAIGTTGEIVQPPITLADGNALAEAGAALVWDRISNAFNVTWAEGNSASQLLHTDSIGPAGEFRFSQQAPLPATTPAGGGWHAEALDLFIAGDDMLLSGVLRSGSAPTTSVPFIMTFDDQTGAYQGGFDSKSVTTANALVAHMAGTAGNCGDGSCMLVVRDPISARPEIGTWRSPVIGYLIGQVTSHNLDNPELSKTEYVLGKEVAAEDTGAAPRATSDGDALITLGVLDSGDLRLQTALEGCESIDPFKGCLQPTLSLGHSDGSPQSFGAPDAPASLLPAEVALDLDSGYVVYALADSRPNGTILFGGKYAPVLSPTNQPLEVAPLAMTISEALNGDPMIVQNRTGWFGLWAEGGRLLFAPLANGK